MYLFKWYINCTDTKNVYALLSSHNPGLAKNIYLCIDINNVINDT